MNWKLPAGFSAAGALVYLILAIARGNPVGVVLLRLLIPAVACGGVGFAVQFLLRRYLPELLTRAGKPDAPAVDIVIDDPMELGAAEPPAGLRSGGLEPGGAVGGSLESGGLGPEGLGPEGLGAEVPELPPEFGGVELGGPGGPAEPSAEALEAVEAAPESAETLPEADELKAPEGAEDFGELERLPALESFAPSTTTRRGLQAEKVEAQVDSLVKGQDPASLAKAVRSFMKKD